VVAKATFSWMDNLIYWRIIRWMKRRHPNKQLSWCFQKYWKRQGDRFEFVADWKSED